MEFYEIKIHQAVLFYLIMKLKNKTNTKVAVTYLYSQCSPSSVYRFSFNCKYTHCKMFDPTDMT